MIKAVGLYSKKAGMSPDAFFRRYEYGHVPLVREIFSGCFAAYTRSYAHLEAAELTGVFAHAPALGFDSLTQLWYRQQADIDRIAERMTQPQNGQRLSDDEQHLFDRGALLSFRVHERGDPPGEPAAALKVAALYTKPAGVAPAAFLEQVETEIAPALLGLRSADGGPLVAGCRRNHLIAGSLFRHPLYDAPAQSPPDLVMELWFRSPGDMRQWSAGALAGPLKLQGVGVVQEFDQETAA
jgi:hypothetical protein